MKKFIAILLSLLLSISMSIAETPEEYLIRMAREDLNQLYYIVSEAIFGKNLPHGIRLYDGRYTVGVDIPIGKYFLKADNFKEIYDYAYIEGYNVAGEKVKTVLGRMSESSPGLLISVTKDVVELEIGSSDNVQLTIYPPSEMWIE